jgi:hypothetical protein
MKKSIYIVGNEQPKELFYKWFGDEFEKAKDIGSANVVVFSGEVPLDPATYGMKKVVNFPASQKKDARDMEIYKKITPEQLIVGISRGAYLACIMNGGKIVQGCDPTFHNGNQTHPIKGDNSRVYEIPSTHTQMMYPYNLRKDKYHLLYYCDPRGGYPSSEILRGTGLDGAEVQNNYEPEIVLFKGGKKTPTALAIQGRPELIPGSPVSNMILNLINDLIK